LLKSDANNPFFLVVALRILDIFMFDSFVCGSIHWVFRDEDTCVNGIGSFNFENEQFSHLSLPPRYDEDDVTLTVFEGCLGVSFFNTSSDPQLEIWVMKEYGNRQSWTKQFTGKNLGFGNLYVPSALDFLEQWIDLDDEQS
jgi:F-box interacting protein